MNSLPSFDPSSLRLPPLEAIDAEIRQRQARRDAEAIRASHEGRGGLINFIRYFWPVLEPATKFVEGWSLEAICQHLEAVTFGELKRELLNVPPGFMKSLTTNVFWPAWEWGPMGLPHLRYVTFSYSASLTERDNGRFRDLLLSPEYQILYGDRFKLRKIGEQRVQNDHHGWKLATSVGGVGTGERGDRVLLDDPHNVKDGESDIVRESTVRWFRETMSNRLNDMAESAIIVIMQRVHENDVAGYIISESSDYAHLMVPMELDRLRQSRTPIGWKDPRTDDGELAWPERFPRTVVDRLRKTLGPYAYSAQYQQSPEPRGGGIIKRDWWKVWDEDEARRQGVAIPKPNGKPAQLPYPAFTYIVASLDTAYTEKDENDPSACTVWGVWTDSFGIARVMLIYAWAEWLEISPLVERVAKTCRDFRVSRILIEAKAAGHSVAQELRRRYLNVGAGLSLNPKTTEHGDFAVQLVNPTKQGDKVSRTYAVQHLFAGAMVYAPDKEWAERVIREVAQFPKAAHDDLHDTVTQALHHLRISGVLVMPDEAEVADLDARQYRSQPIALYQV